MLVGLILSDPLSISLTLSTTVIQFIFRQQIDFFHNNVSEGVCFTAKPKYKIRKSTYDDRGHRQRETVCRCDKFRMLNKSAERRAGGR